jgi:hypothetical protein
MCLRRLVASCAERSGAQLGRWLDFLGMTCPECGSQAEFAFDVTAFFEARPGVWNGGAPQ